MRFERLDDKKLRVTEITGDELYVFVERAKREAVKPDVTPEDLVVLADQVENIKSQIDFVSETGKEYASARFDLFPEQITEFMDIQDAYADDLKTIFATTAGHRLIEAIHYRACVQKGAEAIIKAYANSEV